MVRASIDNQSLLSSVVQASTKSIELNRHTLVDVLHPIDHSNRLVLWSASSLSSFALDETNQSHRPLVRIAMLSLSCVYDVGVDVQQLGLAIHHIFST